MCIRDRYYSSTMQYIERYGSRSLHSGHLYQIFTYVKNKDRAQCGDVAGLLLYAKTGEAIVPNQTYSMSGNKIWVRTLDLGGDFSLIRRQLDAIAHQLETAARQEEAFV